MAGSESSSLSFEDALDYFKSQNLRYDPELIPESKHSLKDIVVTSLFVPKVSFQVKEEIHFIYALTQCAFDWSNDFHKLILSSIYKELTGNTLKEASKSVIWKEVGFQGNDPGTDLRAVGMFGLLQYLLLLTHFKPLGLSLFRVSTRCVTAADTLGESSFPLAVLSINITHSCVQALHNGKLNSALKSSHSVVGLLNSLYGAMMSHYHEVWVTKKKTLKEAGYLLKDTEKYCLKNMKKVFKELPVKIISLA